MTCPLPTPRAPHLRRPRRELPCEVRRALARMRRARPSASRRPASSDEAQRRLETELMVLFRETGMPAAFEALYGISRAAMFSWIVHLVAPSRQACDPAELLQDTYVNVYRYAGGFREEAGDGFRGWARTIAANVVRRSRRRRAITLSALTEVTFEPEDLRLSPDRAAASAEFVLELRRAWVLLLLHYARAFSELSPRDRRALELVEVEGMTYQEAGRVLGVGRSNMKMIMFRSRKRIRAHVLRAMTGGPEILQPRAA